MIPVKLVVHYPATPEAEAELKRRMAGVYAEAVIRQIDSLTCGSDQKIKLSERVEQHVCVRG